MIQGLPHVSRRDFLRLGAVAVVSVGVVGGCRDSRQRTDTEYVHLIGTAERVDIKTTKRWLQDSSKITLGLRIEEIPTGRGEINLERLPVRVGDLIELRLDEHYYFNLSKGRRHYECSVHVSRYLQVGQRISIGVVLDKTSGDQRQETPQIIKSSRSGALMSLPIKLGWDSRPTYYEIKPDIGWESTGPY